MGFTSSSQNFLVAEFEQSFASTLKVGVVEGHPTNSRTPIGPRQIWMMVPPRALVTSMEGEAVEAISTTSRSCKVLPHR